MLKHFFQLTQITLFSLVLLACGNAGTGGGENSTTGGNTSNGSPNSSGDGSGSGEFNAPAEKIGVRIERNSEDGFVERNDIPKNKISIVALDFDFKEGHSTSIPDYISKRQIDGDGYVFEFDQLYIEQSNIVIKAIVGQDSQDNNIVMYAPLYSVGFSDSITVNIFSHYVVKKFFDSLETEADLDAVIPCNTSTCANQVLAKANLLAQINRSAQEYEITIPESLSLSDSLSFLDEQTDFRIHIETAVAEITRSESPIAKGTRRAFGLESLTRLQYNTESNGLWFALSLNDLTPENDKREIVIGAETSAIVDAEEGKAPIYPFYNQFSSFLDVRKEVLTSNIPFTRTSLSVSEANNYLLETSSPSNILATLIQNDTSISTEGFLFNARTLSQNIPDDNGTKNIGWQFNPYYSKLYKANEYERDTDSSLPIDFPDAPNTNVSPTWLIGSNYSTGASFNVTDNGSDNKATRGTQIEDLNIFSWEVHGQETDTSFTIDQLHGKTYGVINYALTIKDGSSFGNTTTLELLAETEQWKINNGEVTLSQPSSGFLSTHFRTYIRSRERDNTVNTAQNDIISGPISNRDISTILTQDSTGDKNRGLIKLDGLLSSAGHSTQDGKHLAFVYQRGLDRNGEDRGRGITIATELSEREPIFPDVNDEDDEGARYTLLGNTFGINTDVNALRNINNSILTLSNGANNVGCKAELVGESAYIEHIVGQEPGQNILSAPLIEKTESITSTSCTQDGNRIEIKFNATPGADSNTMFGQALTLKGFVSPQGEIDDISNSNTPGNVISLLWIQGDNLGLVFATKDQQLSPTFD
jgi:hypothetical protein